MKLIIAIISMLVLVSLISLASAETKYTYDSSGRITEAREFDSSGKQTQALGFDYDSSGRLIKIRGTQHRVESTDIKSSTIFTYDDQKRTITIRQEPEVKVTALQMDNENRIIQLILPGGAKRSWAYNKDGNVASIIDPNGEETRIGYTQDGKIEWMFTKWPGSPSLTELPLFKNDRGEIIALSGVPILPGSLQVKHVFSTDSVAISRWLEFNDGPLSILSPYGENTLREISYTRVDLFNKKLTQKDFDRHLQVATEVARRMAEISNSCSEGIKQDILTRLVEDFVLGLNIRVGEKEATRLLDMIIEDNRELKQYIETAKKLLWPDTSTIKYSSKDKYVFLKDHVPQEFGTDKRKEYDFRGFPAPKFGDILSFPVIMESTSNKIVFDPEGKPLTFSRDALGRPVIEREAEIKFVKLPTDENSPVALAAFSVDVYIRGLYLQYKNKPVEVQATDGSSLYFHVDPSGNIVEAKNKDGKILNKFEYDPSGETLADQPDVKEMSESLRDQKIRDDINRGGFGQFNSPDQLGVLMEALILGVAPASLVYDESACEQTPTPEPTKPVPTTSPQGDDGQGCRGEKDVCRSYSFNTFEACKKDAYDNYWDCKDDCPQGDCIETCYQKYHTTEKDCVAASENQDSACMRAYYFCVKNCPIGGDWQPLSECSNQTPAEPPKCVSITFEIAKTETETERQKASEEEAKCNRACFDAYSDAPNSCSHECDYKKRIDTQDCSNKARQCNRACQNTFVECHEYGCDTRQDELDACEKRCDFEEVACNQPIEPAFKQCQGSCITVRSQCLTGCRTLCPQKVY